MYNSLLNQEVSLIVATKANTFLLYNGILSGEDEKTLKLSNATIRDISGGMLIKIKNIETVVVNKEYIISCNNV